MVFLQWESGAFWTYIRDGNGGGLWVARIVSSARRPLSHERYLKQECRFRQSSETKVELLHFNRPWWKRPWKPSKWINVQIHQDLHFTSPLAVRSQAPSRAARCATRILDTLPDPRCLGPDHRYWQGFTAGYGKPLRVIFSSMSQPPEGCLLNVTDCTSLPYTKYNPLSKRVADEMKALHAQFESNHFWMGDIFGLNPKWAAEFKQAHPNQIYPLNSKYNPGQTYWWWYYISLVESESMKCGSGQSPGLRKYWILWIKGTTIVK